MTEQPIDFESAWNERQYAQDRERLRPYYGHHVDVFDGGDIDDRIGELDAYIEEHGEPSNAVERVEFLKWAKDRAQETYETAVRLISRMKGTDQ